MTVSVSAVVVTYNRRELLAACLAALRAQSYPLERILVVDNASSDGTRQHVESLPGLEDARIEWLSLPENLGGAGGFHAGLRHLERRGYEWAWLMDDDAMPEPDALRHLVTGDLDGDHILGSAAIADTAAKARTLCWPTTGISGDGRRFQVSSLDSDLPGRIEVGSLPFLGFLVHRQLVERIGVPDPGFFVSGDDLDYCERARQAGARVYLVTRSVVRHPLPVRTDLAIFGRRVSIVDAPPWRRYFEVRNRLIVAGRYHPVRLWLEVLPGAVLRWLVTLWVQTDRWDQTRAYVAGLWDGLRHRKGLGGSRPPAWR